MIKADTIYDKQMEQIKQQLLAGTRILRSYMALEHDIRVVVKFPGEECETRYTIRFDADDYPTRLMP